MCDCDGSCYLESLRQFVMGFIIPLLVAFHLLIEIQILFVSVGLVEVQEPGILLL